MKILITGGAGYVGSRVVSHLLSQGHQVRVLDRLLYGGEALLPLTAMPIFELQVGDVRNRDAMLQAMQGTDAVIHLAGIVGEPACNVDKEFSWSINHGAVANLLEVASEVGVGRLIFVSTCSNYGVAEPNAAVDEDAPLNPISDYARAKVLAEGDVLRVNAIPTVTVLRLGTICGLSARMRFDLLVNEMAREAVLGRPVDIFAPEAWRPYLHIDDAAAVMGHVLKADPALVTRRVFNVVGENHQKTSLLAIAREVLPEIQASIVQRKPDLRDYRVSGDRIVKTLGFRPSRTVADAFREVAAAVKAGFFRDPDWAGYSAIPIGGFSAQ
ncbi:MAG: SDR family oxidoreductase [Hyphomicrobiales bacterium]|nr:SDR family oxidoreductase [Hyphomicrobiales bacterium]